jgi:diguanylate cyclase (GGDEF)-like protein
VNTFRPAWLPAGIIGVTALGAWLLTLPAELAGLRHLGPYVLLGIATGLAWWFNRGRTFVIAASLLGAFAAMEVFPGKGVYTLVTVLVPLNVLLAMIVNERGARHGAGALWLALLGIEAVLIAWTGRGPFSGGGELLEAWALRSPPTPLVGRLLFAAAFAAAVCWRAWPDFTPLQVGNAGALAAFFIAAEWGHAPNIYAAFMAAAGAVLIASTLQESHRLAFRDELTGLPGRRALDERLRALPGRYTVAMVDVDHFKKFNDTHGHDIGDQVLKLVGARLGAVGGGGIAYRYGGEEFSVLFPHSDMAEAFPHLEALRKSIEQYRMTVRSERRPKKPEVGAKQRRDGLDMTQKFLSVAVSIGVAQPDGGALRTPAQVLKSADEALYRAKQGGRNRVSR